MAELSLIEGAVLDMTAAGKSPRQIAQELSIPESEAVRLAYELVNREVQLDADQKRALQAYRLEKLVEALWDRTMSAANRDDVKNVILIIEKINELQGLNQELDEKAHQRMAAHHAQVYMMALFGLLNAFKALAPDLMTEAEWNKWGAEQMRIAENTLKQGTGEVLEIE